MKKQHQFKILAASLAAGSGLLLAGCNGGGSTAGGGQTGVATTVVATPSAKSLFSTNSCLTAAATFPTSSSLWWYSGASIKISNSCSTSQDLSSTAFSFTSQDNNGIADPVGTFNNWWVNGDSYAITFTGGALQTGSITTGNRTTPTINPSSSITFTGGGWNLSNAAYNSTLATSSFSMNGGGITPPVNQYGTLNVAVDTVNTNCKGTTTCSGKVTAIVTNSSNVQVTTFTVPDTYLGGTYTQPIIDLAPGTYTVSGSGITDTTISYNPTNAKGIVAANESTTVTVKYDKTAPVVTYGTATISLANVVANYTGSLQVKVLDTKNNNAAVGSFSITQGGSVTTDSLPVSDSTHAYSVQLATGIADPVTGAYYVESSNTTLNIVKGSNTFTIPMVKSAIANKNVTVTISGLESADTAATSFSDAAGKYVYANPSSKTNGSTVYKVESGLNLGVSVAASGSNTYTVNPINNTGVVTAAKTITAGFVTKVIPVSTATYDYVAPFKDYNNKVVLSIQSLTSGKSLSFTSNFQQKSGWGTCFGLSADNITLSNTLSGTKYINTITAKDKTSWDGSVTPQSLDLSQSCDIMGTDSGNAVVLTGVVDPIVYGVTIDGAALEIKKPCADTQCKDPGNGFVNAGYYAQWSVWGRQYNPANMPFNNINDVIYAFIGFDKTTGNIMTLDASADSWGLSAVSRAMLQYPYMKAHLSFGGWTNNGINTAPMFEQLASSQASMDNFTTQAIALMRKTGFSGIDIDWEWWSDYSNNVAPAKKMLTFYQTLRTALDKASKEDGKTYTLTIAVNGGSDRIAALQSTSNVNGVANFWAQVGGLMDHINVMNYDYHGSWDAGSPAYFQANYDFSNTGDNKVGKDEGWSVKSSMATYIANGVPAKKLVAGIPLYARTMTVASATNGGLFQTVTGAGFGDYENGILDYKCIINPVNNPATGCGSDKPIAGVTSLAFYNSTTNVTTFNQYGKDSLQPWAYSATTNSFMTYDDQWSAVEKAKAVKASGLGGTMYWELDGDAQTPSKSIIQAVKDYYNQ